MKLSGFLCSNKSLENNRICFYNFPGWDKYENEICISCSIM